MAKGLAEDRHIPHMYSMLKACKYAIINEEDAKEDLINAFDKYYPTTTVIIDDTPGGIDSLEELLQWADKATGPIAEEVRKLVRHQKTPTVWIGESISDAVLDVRYGEDALAEKVRYLDTTLKDYTEVLK